VVREGLPVIAGEVIANERMKPVVSPVSVASDRMRS
jgi:hypothetical protein